MVRCTRYFFFLLLMSFETAYAVEKIGAVDSSDNSEIFVKWGSAREQIGYRTRDDENPRIVYEKPLAVNSFWIDADKTIYVLEAGRRLKLFRNGKFVRLLELEKYDGYINDFVVVGDFIYAVTSHRLLKITKEGELVSRKEIFGLVQGGDGVGKILYAQGYLVLIDFYVLVSKYQQDMLSRLYHHACLDLSTLQKKPCPEKIEGVLREKQVLDFDGSLYAWNDLDSKTLAISSLDNLMEVKTNIDIVSIFDKIEFFVNSLVRIRYGCIYVVSPERAGLRIVKIKLQ